MSYVIFDTDTGEMFAKADALPISVSLPDGGRSEFSRVGQSEPAKTQRFRLVEVEEATKGPDYPSVISGETGDLVGDKWVVTRTYAPDQAFYQRAIESHIDDVARSRGYMSGVSLSRYGFSTVPQWKAEADVFNEWLDAVWSKALSALADVESGKNPPPSIDEFMAALPVIRWP